jgi:CheY-like chemotaxis protein
MAMDVLLLMRWLGFQKMRQRTLLNSLHRRFQKLFGPRVEIGWISAPALDCIAGDILTVEDILFDIAARARNKMTNGGRIVVEWANVSVEPGSQFSDALTPGRYILVEVTCLRQAQFAGFPFALDVCDLGFPILACDFKQSQAKIRFLGGELWEYNEPSSALTLRALFPSTSKPSAYEEYELAQSSESVQVLLVEDEGFVREVACEMLESEGYIVYTARTAKEALQIFEQNSPIHLLVTDVVMPGMNGQELSKALTNKRPELKTLYMSGYSDHAAAKCSQLELEKSFIQKPFTLEGFTAKVKQLLGTGTAIA